MQQICFLTKQELWWSDGGAIWALALVQRARGRQKTRCDGKLLIHMLIKGHFLSAIRAWRFAYLGLDFCFISPPCVPPPHAPSPLHLSSSCGEKHQCCAQADARETLPHDCWSVTRMYTASPWPCSQQYTYCKLNSDSVMLKSALRTDVDRFNRGG